MLNFPFSNYWCDFYLHEISMEIKSPRVTMVQGLVLGFADLETQKNIGNLEVYFNFNPLLTFQSPTCISILVLPLPGFVIKSNLYK